MGTPSLRDSWFPQTFHAAVSYQCHPEGIRGPRRARPDYDAEDETVIGNIPAGAPREFRTAYSLENPGMAASFRVYVILETGNEAASNTATVTRPGD